MKKIHIILLFVIILGLCVVALKYGNDVKDAIGRAIMTTDQKPFNELTKDDVSKLSDSRLNELLAQIDALKNNNTLLGLTAEQLKGKLLQLEQYRSSIDPTQWHKAESGSAGRDVYSSPDSTPTELLDGVFYADAPWIVLDKGSAREIKLTNAKNLSVNGNKACADYALTVSIGNDKYSGLNKFCITGMSLSFSHIDSSLIWCGKGSFSTDTVDSGVITINDTINIALNSGNALTVKDCAGHDISIDGNADFDKNGNYAQLNKGQMGISGKEFLNGNARIDYNAGVITLSAGSSYTNGYRIIPLVERKLSLNSDCADCSLISDSLLELKGAFKLQRECSNGFSTAYSTEDNNANAKVTLNNGKIQEIKTSSAAVIGMECG